MPDNRQRVVVTGMGAISAVGLNVAENWAALTSGKSGIDYISRFDPTPFETKRVSDLL